MTGDGGGRSAVDDAALLANGDLVAVGGLSSVPTVANEVVRWDGTSWTPVGTWPVNETPDSVGQLADGRIVAAAQLGPQRVATVRVFDGSDWNDLGAGFGSFHRILFLGLDANGDLLAGGTFRGAPAPADHLARWDGANWSGIGAGPGFRVHDVAVLPDGDLVAVGHDALGSATTNSAARFDGTAWTAVDGGITAGPPLTTMVEAAALRPSGELLVGGRFDGVGGLAARNFATLVTPCPASVVPAGSICIGSGGPLTLTARSLPWIDATFRAEANGLPGRCIALHVIGFATAAVPLSSVLPVGLPGCTLLAAPDVVEALVPGSIRATVGITIPDDPALAGLPLHQQVLTLTFDGAPSELAATNRLSLTIGSF